MNYYEIQVQNTESGEWGFHPDKPDLRLANSLDEAIERCRKQREFELVMQSSGNRVARHWRVLGMDRKVVFDTHDDGVKAS